MRIVIFSEAVDIFERLKGVDGNLNLVGRRGLYVIMLSRFTKRKRHTPEELAQDILDALDTYRKDCPVYAEIAEVNVLRYFQALVSDEHFVEDTMHAFEQLSLKGLELSAVA